MPNTNSQLYQLGHGSNAGMVESGHHAGAPMLNTILLAAILIVAIIATYLLHKYASKKLQSSTETEQPLEIIKIRLAKGEIDQAEYEKLYKTVK